VKEIPTKSLYALISPLGMVSAASSMMKTLCLGNKLMKGKNKVNIIPGWKLKLRIDSAMGSESVKRMNNWKGHTNGIADNNLCLTMKGWEGKGKECRGTEDKIFVNTNSCTQRYLYCILDSIVRFLRRK
jgi:hypothetical protein